MQHILIIGSGAREHALCKAFKRSSFMPQISCCGQSINPGIHKEAENYWVGDICDTKKIVALAKEWQVDFVFIGPEAPLEKGLADALWEKNIPVIGPQKKLAQIETSKSFARQLLKKYHIPGSPRYQVFNELQGIKSFLQELGDNQYVIKADGLMGGKGVKVAGDHLHSLDEAYQFCESLIANKSTVVIEEKLIGQEFSLLAFCDGKNLAFMPIVQDHKRALIHDQGDNTGGMGSYSDMSHSLPFLTKDDIEAAKKINRSVMQALQEECGENYIGILYGSFIATKEGVRTIEFNARFGDPEAMNVLAILESDFLMVCQAMLKGELAEAEITFSKLATVCKYAVPLGYPAKPEKNFLVDVSDIQNPSQLYLAAVDVREGQLVATGSRTAAVVGVGQTLSIAENMAEKEIQRIKGKLFHRSDIGTEALIERRINHMKELRQCTV